MYWPSLPKLREVITEGRLIDGNTDAINECMRQHLRKLAKVTTRKSKKNNAKVAAHPTKLAFVIFFDNGSKKK